MKTYLRIALLFIVVAVVMAVAYAAQQVTAPESALIISERNKLYAARDQARLANDPAYVLQLRDKLRVLDYRLAISYNVENNPDAAVGLLQKLIDDEEGKSPLPRSSRSYLNEARYVAVLKDSYGLKKDEVNAGKMTAIQEELNAKAAAARKRAISEEGKHVGFSGE